MESILKGRQNQVMIKGTDSHELSCEKSSIAGSVSQRACVFCGSRVVLYPIADAVQNPLGYQTIATCVLAHVHPAKP